LRQFLSSEDGDDGDKDRSRKGASSASTSASLSSKVDDDDDDDLLDDGDLLDDLELDTALDHLNGITVFLQVLGVKVSPKTILFSFSIMSLQ